MAVAVRLLGADGMGSIVVVVVTTVVVVVGRTEVEVVVGSTEVVVVVGRIEVVVVVGRIDVVEVVGSVEVVLVVTMTVVVVEATVVVVMGVTSHTSPTPSPSLSRWSLMHNPLDEQPITQSASLVQVMPGLSEVDEQVPRFEPLGLLGQLS